MIATLIDKLDNVERVRDRIAEILLAETVSQRALAVTVGKPDPDLWSLRIFLERSLPWTSFLPDEDSDEEPTDLRPIVNVSFDSESFDESASNTIDRQRADAKFNIDCYGYGVSRDDGSGHIPGDEDAVKTAQRAGRLVRNILMAAEYHQLSMAGVVTRRFVSQVTAFAPSVGDIPVERVAALRIVLSVWFGEYAPQVVPIAVSKIVANVRRADNGELLCSVTVPVTPAP